MLDGQLFFTADDGTHGRELWSLASTPTAVEQDLGGEATRPAVLSPPYPNPFDDQTALTLTVARRQHVSVALYDLLGRRLALLHHGLLSAETRLALNLDGAHLPGGVYVVRATGETFTASHLVVRF